MEAMRQGLSTLELNVGRILEQSDVDGDVDPMSLSRSHIATIVDEAGGRGDGDGRITPSRLRAILEQGSPRRSMTVAGRPRDPPG